MLQGKVEESVASTGEFHVGQSRPQQMKEVTGEWFTMEQGPRGTVERGGEASGSVTRSSDQSRNERKNNCRKRGVAFHDVTENCRDETPG